MRTKYSVLFVNFFTQRHDIGEIDREKRKWDKKKVDPDRENMEDIEIQREYRNWENIKTVNQTV